MWDALSAVSVLIGFAAFFGAIVGLIKGVIGKGWGLLAYSTVILITSVALIAFAAGETVWYVAQSISALICLMALVGIIVGLIRAVMRRGWGFLFCSTVILIVFFSLVVFADAKENPNEAENRNAPDNFSAPERPSAHCACAGKV